VTPLVILYGAAGGWGLAAVTGLAGGQTRRGMRACCVLSGLGGGAATAGGAWALVSGDTHVVTLGRPAASASAIGGSLQLQLTGLAGVFVALLGVVAAAAIALYAPRYHAPGRGTGLYLTAYNLALLACLAVLAAGGMVTFLVAWESMSLLCYLLILRHPGRRDVARGAFWFLALSETGFLLIVAAFVILAAKTHATQLDLMAARAHLVPGGWRDAAYLLALAGFGFKAGLVPLHVWLPEAHPVAPADGSAFLSGVVVKIGVYGIALFAFRLLPGGGSWPGLVTMGAGAVTAAIGILYALSERDIKRFLAYSTIENIGIIVTAFGAAMTFHAYRQSALWAFLLLAALYHVANHGCYKTLLFLEAGVVEHTTGTRDMDRLGGLIHRLPRSAVIAFAGTLGIAALPPLNGFVSEWLIFQGCSRDSGPAAT
jgi:formate hydrogenlyase subunit 3/multisubunit Na+/H+ antiporter MnhD subunit